MKMIKVVLVQPMQKPQIVEIPNNLRSLQETVGGYIQAIYPFKQEIALVCNEEAKVNGCELNRALFDEAGTMYDIVAGTFFVCGLGEEDFESISDEDAKIVMERFAYPERFLFTPAGVIVEKIIE